MDEINVQNVIKKMSKKDNIFQIAGIILLLIGIIGFALVGYKENEELPEAIPLIESQKVGEYCKVEIYNLTNTYASYGSEEDTQNTDYYYLIYDEQYVYIASLSKSQFSNIVATFNGYTNQEEFKPIEVLGVSKEIPQELKNLTIEYYNEILDADKENGIEVKQEQYLTQENFEEYLGKTYIDCKENPNTELVPVYIVIGIFFTVFGIVFLIVGIRNKIITKRSIKNLKEKEELDNLQQELEDCSTTESKKIKTIITKNYVISYFKGLEIVNLKDVEWIYPFTYRVNGVSSYNTIMLVTSDKKKHEIAKCGNIGKCKEQYDELYNSIYQKRPDALYGYTKENKEAIKNK